MTPAGWLRNHVGDGTVTILIARRATFVRMAELTDLVAGRLRHGAVVRDVHDVYAGLVRPSRDGSRYWIDLGPAWAFVWSCDLHALIAGEMITAELQPVIGMMAEPEPLNTVPALSAGFGPLHA